MTPPVPSPDQNALAAAKATRSMPATGVADVADGAAAVVVVVADETEVDDGAAAAADAGVAGPEAAVGAADTIHTDRL